MASERTGAEVTSSLVIEGLMRGGGAVPTKLVVVAGPDEGVEVPLRERATIGTDLGCQLVLRDPAVSRQHAAITADGGRYSVRDLQSRNGTYVGDTRVGEATVPLGALLRLGNTTIAIHPRWWMREVAPGTSRRFGELYGESVAMREAFAILERVAPTDVTVLIEGESGTGKELAARSTHRASLRAERPLVAFDCASIPRELAESELFGHRRGAFSGALDDRAGAFQHAHGGTLFLDEIGELPSDLQPKLLRALETGEVRRVGDDAARKVDVRIVAATNRDLGAESRRGTFRSDLYYRLEVVKIRMPPLRQRPEDVAGLVTRLLEGRISPAEAIDGENLRRLTAYSWPGNVRELRNVLERAVALAAVPGDLPRFGDLVLNLGPTAPTPVTLGANYPGVESRLDYKEAKRQLLASFDRAYVSGLLERHGGNLTQAAAAAGLSRKHLYELIRRTNGEP